MIHVNLFEMLDDLSHYVARMRRDAATVEPDETAARTMQEQAEEIEQRFLTDEQTGEVFPFGERTRAIWIARVIAQEERSRPPRPHPPADAKPIDCLVIG